LVVAHAFYSTNPAAVGVTDDPACLHRNGRHGKETAATEISYVCTIGRFKYQI